MNPLLSYILFIVYGFIFVIGRIFGYFQTVKDFAYLYLTNPSIFYYTGRMIFGVLCGTAAILFIYRVGKRYFNKATGILAAALLAFNFLHVRDSHYIYFDIPLTLLVLIFFVKAYDFFGKPTRLDYIKLGFLFGLAVSIKYQGALLLLPLSLIVINDLYNRSRNKALSHKTAVGDIFFGISASLITMFICNPFSFLEFNKFIKSVSGLPYIPAPPAFHLKVSLINGCGLLLIILGIAGMLWALVKRRREQFILLIYAIFYYMVMIKATQMAERLMLPLIPIFILFASHAVFSLASVIRRKYSMFFIVIMSIILAYPSIARIYYSDLLFMKEDTRTQAYKWIKENITKDARVALDATTSGFPRLERNEEQVKEMTNYFTLTSFKKPERANELKIKFMLENPNRSQETYYLFYLRERLDRGFLSVYPAILVNYPDLVSRNIKYVVLSNIAADERYKDFMEILNKDFRLLKVFSPYKEGIFKAKTEELSALPAGAFIYKELRERKSYGPVIKIYERI